MKKNELNGFKHTIFLLKKTNLNKKVYVKLILIYVISAISAIFTALFNAKIIEHITSANFDNFIAIVLCLGVANAVKMTFQNFQTIFNVKFQNKMVKAINNCNYKRVLSLEISNFNKNNSEEFQNRIYSANQISTIITNSLSNFIINLSDVEANAIKGSQLYDDNIFKSGNFGTIKKNNLIGNIKINNLDFSYENDNILFKNLYLNIESNKITAIVGRSGEGKTTILSLINKFYHVDNNKIFIDEIDINNYDETTIRNNIAFIQQQPYIFNMTFRENLLLIKPDATEKELIDVCKRSEIYDFISSQKDGFDTIIGENGITISGGQKQRFAIARALLNNADIIMFDESTSSLDNESQNKIQKVIEKLSVDHTIITVAHRLSTIKNADNIIFIKDHSVQCIGIHDELIKNCIDYKNYKW